MERFATRLLAALLAASLAAAPGLAQGAASSAAQAPSKSSDKKKSSKDDVSQIGNRDVDGKVNFVSLESELAIGKQYAQEIERSVKLVDDPVVIEYVQRVGRRLVANSDAKLPFTIKVIDSDVLNAFALPGGFFYVNSGLILAADEEAEMAGVMAHEIAHVTARHGTRQMTRGQITNLLMIPAMIFLPGGWAGWGIYQGLNFFIPLTFLSFSRGFEAEADYLGLQYMYKTGYDPNAYISFFEKVQAQDKKRPGSIPKIFSSHPPSAQRIAKTQQEIATILPARQEYILSTSEFDYIKARLYSIQSASKAKGEDPDKPTLRKRTEKAEGKKGKKTEEDDDERPTLKRRP